MDIEGVVIKYKLGAYGEGWFKVLEPAVHAEARPSRDVRRFPGIRIISGLLKEGYSVTLTGTSVNNYVAGRR